MQPWEPSPTATAAVGVRPDRSAYWCFYEGVALAQLQAWMPPPPCRVLDISGAHTRFARELSAAGHRVVEVVHPRGCAEVPPDRRLQPVVADGRWLDWLADGSVDAVLAERLALSFALATEVTLDDIARVLRPGGRLLMVVDSLQLGLSRLARDGRWAELADAPAADVLLVPHSDGTIRRCFSPDDLDALLRSAGLEVDWVRPRTVLSPDAVEHALRSEPQRLADLVTTEIALEQAREGDSTGNHLVASARKPGG